MWIRPDSVPVGQVWLRFQGREVNGQPARTYEIRDMEEKDRKRCLDFMQTHFLQDEPLCKVLNILSDPVSVTTIRSNWENLVSQHVSLACYCVEDDEVVGFNNLLVTRKGEESSVEFEKIKGESWRRLASVLDAAGTLVDVFDRYGVDVCLEDSGLGVHPAHRGQGIGARLLDARKPLCAALGITTVATVFTAKASQIIAQKCGYELLGSLPYSDAGLTSEEMAGLDTGVVELRGKRFMFEKCSL